jgi:hypothetical protein
MDFLDTAVAVFIVALAAFFLLKRLFSKGGCSGCSCGGPEERGGKEVLEAGGRHDALQSQPCGAPHAGQGDGNNCSGCQCAGRVR